MAHGDPRVIRRPARGRTPRKQRRSRIDETRGSAVEGVAMLQRVVATTTDMIGHTTNAQLSNPTLCTEWTVKDLINHMVTGATMFAISAEQGSIPDDELGKLMSGDNVGNDPQGAWDDGVEAGADRVRAAGRDGEDREAAVRRDAGRRRAQHRDLRRRDATRSISPGRRVRRSPTPRCSRARWSSRSR